MRVIAPFFMSMLILLCAAAHSADYTLWANDADGYDNVWQSRPDAGKPSWGIKGTGSSLTGTMWFNSFPGASGEYEIVFGVVIEDDGPPEYAVKAGGQTLKSGKYPCPGGSCGCSKNSEAATINIGRHTINNGAKIEVWGKSVYPCGSHGAYTRWYNLEFTRISTIEDTTPPSKPGNLSVSTATNSSLTFTWNAASDGESGIKQYKVYVDGSFSKSVTETSAEISGLSRNTSYSIQVSAVNNANLEGAKSDALIASTTNEAAPTGTLWIGASDGTMSNGMSVAWHPETKSDKAMYGITGSTSAPTASCSKAVYSVDIPSTGTWYAWGRFNYNGQMNNSFWIQVDDGAAERFGNGEDHLDGWHWDGYLNGGAVNLGTISQGSHTITLYAREADINCLLDVFCLTPSSSYSPDDADVALYPDMDGYVRLDYPNGGEVFEVGEEIIIRWSAKVSHVNDATLKFSGDGGVSWEEITSSSISTSSEYWDNFSWTVPQTVGGWDLSQPLEGIFRIEQYEATEQDLIDISDSASCFSGCPSGVVMTRGAVSGASPVFSLVQTAGNGLTLRIASPVAYTAKISDLKGREVLSLIGNGPATRSVVLPHAASGLYVITFVSEGVRTIRSAAVSF